jgi:hypothetical protein
LKRRQRERAKHPARINSGQDVFRLSKKAKKEKKRPGKKLEKGMANPFFI